MADEENLLKSGSKSFSSDLNNNPQEKRSYYREDYDGQLSQDMRHLLLTYSEVPEPELDSHLHTVRNKAWSAKPYPCIGIWAFLNPRIRKHPAYSEILAKARAGVGSFRICDVGTGFGQELRLLRADGVSASSLYATDIVDELWDCGFDLFCDREAMRGTQFLRANTIDLALGNKSPLEQWAGSMDVVVAGHFLHLFDWDVQVAAGKGLAALTKKEKGSRVIGWMMGGDPGPFTMAHTGTKIFVHDEATFRELWKVIRDEVGEPWTVNLRSWKIADEFKDERYNHDTWGPKNMTIIVFDVIRESS